jgi:hypothetical protein
MRKYHTKEYERLTGQAAGKNQPGDTGDTK